MTRPIDTLREMASASLVAKIETAIEEGRAYWRSDPHHPGVSALFVGGKTVMVVYTNELDFEHTDDIEELL